MGRALDDVHALGPQGIRRFALEYLPHHGIDPAITDLKSMTGSDAVIPKRAASLMPWADLAALSRVLLGTHPVQVQSPPKRPFSTKATDRSIRRANRAAVSPADPPPMISKS